MTTHDVAIIGAGPAGIAAAIQLLRSGIRPLLLEGGRPGGLLWEASRVENYPGFPMGISGPSLARRLMRHLRQMGGVVHQEQVMTVEMNGDFEIRTQAGEQTSRIVILATGTRPRAAEDIEIAPDARDRVTRHIWPIRGIRDRDVVVLGAGDAAFDYALTLARRNDVILVQRSPRPRCLALLQDRVADHPRIRIIREHQLLSVQRNGACLRLTLASQDGIDTMNAEHVVLAIGREPDTRCLSSAVMSTRETLMDSGRLHLIGDVVRGRFRQASIAVGDGVRAAMEVCAHLEGRDDADR